MPANRRISSAGTGNAAPAAGAPEAAGHDGIPVTGGEAADGQRPERVPLRQLMDDRLLDALLERSRDEAGGLRLTGEGSMLGELVKAVLERALEAELTAHLGYERDDRAGRGDGNYRNGTIAKTVQTGVGPVPLQVPRDRAGSFEPLLIPKRAGRITGGLDDMIISLYAHGMSVRDILHHLEQVYGTKLSAETVSRITDQVLEEVRAWQSRPLDPVYAVVFLDAIVVKVRDSHVVQNKPAYLPVGIDADGEKHVLGIWVAKTPPGEGAAGEGRGLLARRHGRPAQPGRTGHPDRLLRRAERVRGRHHRRVPPHGRAALRCPSRQERPAPGGPPRRRPGRDGTAQDLHRTGRRRRPRRPRGVLRLALGQEVPAGRQSVRGRLGGLHAVPGFSPAVRKVLYTTNSIESLNYQLRKVTKARGHFPNDDAVVKLLWLAIINIEDKRARERAARRQESGKRSDQPARLVEGQRVMGWREALNELDAAYPGRLR